MTVQEFIKCIEEEYEELEPGVLKPESSFRENFEWNSINALILIALVDSEFDVTITAEDITNSKTVQDLYDAITAKQ